MTQETSVEMWRRRAILRHVQSHELAQKLADVQALCRALHMEYDKAVIEGATLCRALSAMSDLASQAGCVHRYCRCCGRAWALALADVPAGARSGASVCDACMAEHDHWRGEKAGGDVP